ncbi:hypothetical protein D3C83_330670 [compost metagenome]
MEGAPPGRRDLAGQGGLADLSRPQETDDRVGLELSRQRLDMAGAENHPTISVT